MRNESHSARRSKGGTEMRTTILLGNSIVMIKHIRKDVAGKGFKYSWLKGKWRKDRQGRERERLWEEGKKMIRSSTIKDSVSMQPHASLDPDSERECLSQVQAIGSGELGIWHRSCDFKVHAYSLLPLSTAGISGHTSKRISLVRTWFSH